MKALAAAICFAFCPAAVNCLVALLLWPKNIEADDLMLLTSDNAIAASINGASCGRGLVVSCYSRNTSSELYKCLRNEQGAFCLPPFVSPCPAFQLRCVYLIGALLIHFFSAPALWIPRIHGGCNVSQRVVPHGCCQVSISNVEFGFEALVYDLVFCQAPYI